LQETGKEVWGIETGDLRLLQKARDQKTKERQGASDRGVPFVPEAGSDVLERVYYECERLYEFEDFTIYRTKWPEVNRFHYSIVEIGDLLEKMKSE